MSDNGSWGFKGLGARALELPAGENTDISPADRGRLRYNSSTSQLEFSANAGAYVPLGMGGASPWLSAAGVTRLQDITDTVAIGATTMVGSEKVRIIGDVRVESQVQVTEITSVPGSSSDLEVSADTGNVNMTITGGTGLTVQNGIGNPILSAIPTGTLRAGSSGAGLNSIELFSVSSTIEGEELNYRAGGSTDNILRAEAVGNTFTVGQGAPLLEVDQVNFGTQLLNAATSPNALRVVQGGDDYLNIDTAGGTLQVGSTGGTGGSLNFDGGMGSTTVEVTDSFVLTDGTDSAVVYDTSAGNLSLGGPSIEVIIPGNNNLRIDGGSLCIAERAADPAAVANEGKVYTKDVAGITELFYRDSAGNVRQLTPPSAGGVPGGANTDVQFNNAGTFDGNAGFTYDGTNVTIANRLDVPTLQGTAGVIDVGNGVSDLTLSATPASATAISIGTSNSYISVDDSAGAMTLGNASSNPDLEIAGSGDVRLTGGTQLVITERVGDPGATAGTGKVYTKDVAGTSELFYQDGSGNVRQLTPPSAGGTPGGANTDVQFNNAGTFDGSADFTFDGSTIALGPSVGISNIETSINLKDNVFEAFIVKENARSFIEIDTNLGGNTEMRFGGNNTDTRMVFTVPEQNGVWAIREETTGREWMNVNTGGFNRIELGNTSKNPSVEIFGVGGLYLRGDVSNGSFLDMQERAIDPGFVANRGRLYTKDVSAITELFYQDSAGNVRQLTPTGGPASSSSAIQVTQVASEVIGVGSPVTFVDSAGNALSQNGDADAAGRTNVVGVAATAGLPGDPHEIITDGEASIPTSIFDVAPVAADVGATFFLSTTQGQVTLTAPTSSGDTVLRIGKIKEISGGNAICIIQIGDPVVL